MGAPIELSYKDYSEGLQKVIDSFKDGKSYANQFKIELPDGINTASTLEICRIMEKAELEDKVHLARVCLLKKNVVVTCPNGEVEKFYMSNMNDSFDAFPLFEKEPYALTAIADCVYGYILKKSLRLSNAQEPAADATA